LTYRIYQCVFRTHFFADVEGLEGEVRQVMLVAGQAIVIPSGYLHFVLTVMDSVAVGCNFLTAAELDSSSKAFVIERFNHVDPDLCFPQYEAVIASTVVRLYNQRYIAVPRRLAGRLQRAVQRIMTFQDSKITIAAILNHVRFPCNLVCNC
jgi:hypothetical protein